MSDSFSSLQELLDEIQNTAFDPATADRALALGEALVSVLDLRPTLAQIEAQASGAGTKRAGAVANQQLGNIIGMVTTMNCVQTLLGADDLRGPF